MPAPRAIPGLLASALLGLLLGTCGPPADQPPGLETRLRFVEHDPQAILAREELVTAERLFSWRPQPEDECLPIWPSTQTTAEITLGGRLGRLDWQADRVQVRIDRAADAAAADRLDVVLRNLAGENTRTGPISLLWAGGGEAFSGDRSLAESHGEPRADGSRRFRFPVGAHSSWRGRVARLNLTIQPPVGSRIALCSIDGMAEKLRRERLAELTRSGFKAVLGGQIRNVLPALPGLPVERGLEVPANAVLRFACGLPEGSRAAVSFRVTAVAASGGTELFRALLTPDEDGGRWREAEADLAPVAGERITLRLETSAEGLDPEHGLPLWGNPEVLAPR